MPLRYITQSQTFQYLTEGTSLFFLSVFAFVTETDWQRITGPHGVAFVAIAAVIVLWGSGIRDKALLRKETEEREIREEKRREKEESAREARHAESIKLQRENAEKLIGITVENIKAAGHVTQAINSMDRTIQQFSHDLGQRPCQQLPKT
jgi:flagellar biosynthesis component FlhA